MSSELAPLPHCYVRRFQRIEAITARERQIAWLQAQQRLDVHALNTEDLDGMSERFVVSELASAWGRSPRQAQSRLDDARLFAMFPCLHPLIADGTWLMDHVDAVLGELIGCGLTEHADLQQVLDLVLSRNVHRTPYELKVAVRTALVVLFPTLAAQRAEKARADRDVSIHHDTPGSAQLYAHGPAADVAAMMASLDTLCWPPAPDDTRTMAQRRFDTLRELVCGQARPGQWQVQVLIDYATLVGADERPAEIPGLGPVPAPIARETVLSAELRRVVVDEHGQLVAVDPVLHRPDQTTPAPAPAGSSAPAAAPGGPLSWAHEDCDDTPVEEPVEPDPDAPSPDDLAWFAQHLQCTAPRDGHEPTHTEQEAASATRALPFWDPAYVEPEPAPAPDPDPAAASAACRATSWWSEIAFATALHRIRTDPVTTVDLSTDRYRVPVRLKRHLVLRDRTCVFPGCPRLAVQCDSDHLLPWPRGRTSEVNLGSECEHHHQAKHDRFRVARLPDGTFRWTTPAGHTYDRPPRPVLDNHRYPRPPDPDDTEPA